MSKMTYTILSGVCIAVSLFYAMQAVAQTAAPLGTKTLASEPASGSRSIAKVSRPYYIEFRARSALSYGHTFAVIGRVGAKLTPNNVVGLHPITESSVPWMIGHVVPVPSETGFSDGDIEDLYIVARYRILLTVAEYKKLNEEISRMKSNTPLWHAALYNCNAFVGDIATSLGLKAPTNRWLLPKDYITALKEINHGIKQLPAG
jgi:hypothetical protein